MDRTLGEALYDGMVVSGLDPSVMATGVVTDGVGQENEGEALLFDGKGAFPGECLGLCVRLRLCAMRALGRARRRSLAEAARVL